MPIREMDWNAHVGQKARIYRNLNNGRMSVQVKVGKSWKVVGHVLEAVLEDVRFHVPESGRQRVIRDGCKNVHAWGEGLLLGPTNGSIFAPVDLAYNPYLNATFMERGTGHSITGCKSLVVRENHVFVTPDAVDGSGDRPIFAVIAGGQSCTQCPASSRFNHRATAA